MTAGPNRAVGEWATEPEEISPESELQFETLPEFVEQYLVEMCWRDVEPNDTIWCPEWWKHPAACVRLEAIWRAFEHLRQDPALGISIWLRDHADPHMAVLLDPAGPFKGCDHKKGGGAHDGERVRVLPIKPVGPGLYEPGD